MVLADLRNLLAATLAVVAFWSVPAAGAELSRPRLNALLIGITAYPEAQFRLNFAAKDAQDLSEVLRRQQGGGLFGEVNLRLLTDAEATRGNIRSAFEWLRQNAANPDTTIIFLVGHGLPDERRSTFLLPVDGDIDSLSETAIGQAELRGMLTAIPGHVVALIDICHVGGPVPAQLTRGLNLESLRPDMAGLVTMLSSSGNGAVVLSGGTARLPAVDLPQLGNGAFAAALVEGLNGAADRNRDGVVGTEELSGFVADRVNALSAGRQQPVVQRGHQESEFPVVGLR